MSVRRFVSTTLAVLTLGTAGPLGAQETQVPVPVTGRTLNLRLEDGERLTGELIEVGERDLLLWGDSGFHRLGLEEVDRAEYVRHGFSGSTALAWVGLGGLLNAVGMTIACSQVEDTSCGGVFAGVALSWVVVGGLFAGSIASGRTHDVEPTYEDLRGLSRFPQGAPEGFRERAERTGRPPGR
jgi:hypothetical protein